MDSFQNSDFFADFRDENYNRYQPNVKLLHLLNEKVICLTLTEKKKIQFRAKIGQGHTGGRSRVRLRTAQTLFFF